MDRIYDRLCIGGLESGINAGADDLRVGEGIIRSPLDLKTHLVATYCEGVDFGGFFYSYNILTCIQQILKGKDNLVELVKHKKYLSGLKMFDDEAMTLSTLYPLSPHVCFGVNAPPSQTLGLFLTTLSGITSLCRWV